MSNAAVSAASVVRDGRDLTLDLTRVACVVLVVFVHILFTGVGRRPDGSLLIERTVEGQVWFDAVSWILNIMPLFFVVGGYAARAGWRSAQRRGDDAVGFVRLRLARLARPAIPVLVFFSVALAATRMLGVDPALVDTIAIGVGSPLWFLAAYLLVQALAPWMIGLHARFGMIVPLVLLAGAAATDALRFLVAGGLFGLGHVPSTGYGIGAELFGIPNVVFVWLFAQQVGFFLFDGWFSRRRFWQLLGLIAAGYLAIWGLVSLGGYSWNMLSNQWPPTTPLAILAVVQAAALTVLHRPLTALMRTRAAQGAVLLIGSRLMTVYLWHLPMIMVLIGVQLLLPVPMPAPGSALWWWTRVPFLIVVLAAVWLLSLWLVRFEKAPAMGEKPSRGVTATAVVVFLLPILAITAYGLDLPLAVCALIASALALRLVGAYRAPLTPAGASAPRR
ncbi:acyltransferase family protein [Microbacterium azadirachtae]|uniref:Acyltransferase family protein n=1 Tax=Microbacterium azadirachtae TaxID=582680 RepID=A0A0F0LT47_9MICO|nr:acyltransferase [Microbacterium azadirachtae]KJL35889.1 Acyltransferase family protein [Microbacterium azadirachtae]